MVKLCIQGLFAQWLHVGGITAGQLDIFDACIMSVSSSRSHFHVRIRSVSGHCFEIERLTPGQHSVGEKDGVVNRLYSGFQKSCSAEAFLVLINPVSLWCWEVELDGIISTWWCSLLVCGLMGTGTRCRRVRVLALLEVCKRPWSPRGSRRYALHGSMGLMAGQAACCTQYIRCFPFLSVFLPARCTVTVSGAAGHNQGGVVERRVLERTHGRTGDCTFHFLPPRTVAGWLSGVSFQCRSAKPSQRLLVLGSALQWGRGPTVRLQSWLVQVVVAPMSWVAPTAKW